MDGAPGMLAFPKPVNTAPVVVVSLNRCRVNDAFAVAVGKKAAAATSLCVRASVMRKTAARRSRLEAVLRSISEDSVGSWKVLHQFTTACGSVLIEFDAVDVADQAAGTCGSGREKL